MTGVAKINSATTFDEMQDQFIERLGVMKLTHKLKMAWHALCVCKAVIEISEGDKIRVQEIHEGMVVKYKKWACQLLQLDEVIGGELPAYVKE